MAQYEFLSDEWLTEVKKISENIGGDAPSGPAADLKINVVVTGGPSGDRELHLAGGTFNSGAVEGAPTKLTVPYEVAKDMFVNGNQQAGMQAFMSGQIKVEGDMSKLMAMQQGGANPNQAKLQEEIKAITA
jgi:putative sterol carrier protein